MRSFLDHSARHGVRLFLGALGLNVLALATEHTAPMRWVFEHAGPAFLAVSGGCVLLGGALLLHAAVAGSGSPAKRVGLGLCAAVCAFYLLLAAMGPG